ncbi:MAG: thiamine pyrophosphate-dependent enzyme [Candidatus Omnitrophica bacterium]|nr:thiamine pyrophosphate-dependent enzyme [Candidatus Omnitrophota bacterium]
MNIQKLVNQQKETRKRIVELSYQSNFAHLGSNFSAIDIIDVIYKTKMREERFVLSAGHAGIALYVILEKNRLLGQSKIKELHIHPDRNIKIGIDVSTGSLGQGLPIALGMALADKTKRVFCLVSDGECAEGSIWESLRIVYDEKIKNLVLIVNANGWGAYNPILIPVLLKRIRGFGFNVIITDGHKIDSLLISIKAAGKKQPAIIFAKTNVEQLPFLKGQDAHYYVMNEDDYKTAMELLR